MPPLESQGNEVIAFMIVSGLTWNGRQVSQSKTTTLESGCGGGASIYIRACRVCGYYAQQLHPHYTLTLLHLCSHPPPAYSTLFQLAYSLDLGLLLMLFV